MQIVPLNTSELHITTDTTILDRWEVSASVLHVASGVLLHYVCIGEADGDYVRSFHLGEGVHFDGGVVIYGHNISYQATTYIEGDNVSSHLQILGLARTSARLDIRGSSVVDAPYRHTVTRVDQNNIFLGEGGSIRGMPVLEIATDDIEWGHSCRIHRVAPEALFYLQSHGLDATTAEWLLIEAELRKHTSHIGDCDMCDSLVEEIRGVVFWE
jgi:hypothetical protein